jgi:cytochrome c556
MPKRSTPWFRIIVVLPAAAALTLIARADPPPASTSPKSFKPVQSVEHLMEGQDKLYEEIKEGIIDKTWKPAQTSAWLLAELANVNQFQSNESKYQELAVRMSNECVELAAFLRKRDESAAKSQITRISQTCKACHDAYQDKSKE